MITTNTGSKDLEDVGLLFHSILRYAEANAERLDRSIIAIGYSTLLRNADQASGFLAQLHVESGEEWDGCVWLERLEDISEGSLAQKLYADGVDVESAVTDWLSRYRPSAQFKVPVEGEDTASLYLMNKHGHYFKLNLTALEVDKDRLHGCTFYESEAALLEAVCRLTGCDLDEVSGSTSYVALRNGEPTIFDARGIGEAIEGPVEDCIVEYEV